MKLDSLVLPEEGFKPRRRTKTTSRMPHKRWLPHSEAVSVLPDAGTTRLPLLQVPKKCGDDQPQFVHPLPEPPPEPTLEEKVKKQLEMLVAKYSPAKATPLYKVIFMKSCSDVYAQAMDVVVQDYATHCGEHPGVLGFVWRQHRGLFQDLTELFNMSAEQHHRDVQALQEELQTMRFNYLSAVAEIEAAVREQGDAVIVRRLEDQKKDDDRHRELTQMKKIIKTLEHESDVTQRERNLDGQAMHSKRAEEAFLRSQLKAGAESLAVARNMLGEAHVTLGQCFFENSHPREGCRRVDHIETLALPRPRMPPENYDISTQTSTAVPQPAPLVMLTGPEEHTAVSTASKKKTPSKKHLVKSSLELKRLHQAVKLKGPSDPPASATKAQSSSPRARKKDKKDKAPVDDVDTVFKAAPSPQLEGVAFPKLLLKETCAWPGVPLKCSFTHTLSEPVSVADMRQAFEHVAAYPSGAPKRKRKDEPQPPPPVHEVGEVFPLAAPELFRYFLGTFSPTVTCRPADWFAVVSDSMVHNKLWDPDSATANPVEFVHAYFSGRFAEKDLAQAWLCDFLGTCKAHANASPRAAMLCHFLGLMPTPFTHDAFEAYCAVARCISGREQNALPVKMPLDKLKQAVSDVFQDIVPKGLLAELCEAVTQVAHPDATPTCDVHVDTALFAMVARWDAMVSTVLATSVAGLIPESVDTPTREKGEYFFARFLPAENAAEVLDRVYHEAPSVPRLTLADSILAAAAHRGLEGVKELIGTLKLS